MSVAPGSRSRLERGARPEDLPLGYTDPSFATSLAVWPHGVTWASSVLPSSPVTGLVAWRTTPQSVVPLPISGSRKVIRSSGRAAWSKSGFGRLAIFNVKGARFRWTVFRRTSRVGRRVGAGSSAGSIDARIPPKPMGDGRDAEGREDVAARHPVRSFEIVALGRKDETARSKSDDAPARAIVSQNRGPAPIAPNLMTAGGEGGIHIKVL